MHGIHKQIYTEDKNKVYDKERIVQFVTILQELNVTPNVLQ